MGLPLYYSIVIRVKKVIKLNIKYHEPTKSVKVPMLMRKTKARI